MAQENSDTDSAESTQLEKVSTDDNEPGLAVPPETEDGEYLKTSDDRKADKPLTIYKPELPVSITTRDGEYIKAVAVHATNLSVIPVVLMITALGGHFWLIPFLVLGELLAVFGISRLSIFRRAVDEKRNELERAAAAGAREMNLVQMSEFRRTEFEELENFVRKIRTNVNRYGDTAVFIIDEQQGLNRLLHGYTQLAISHRARVQCLALADRSALQAKIEALQKAASEARVENMREILEKRVLIATKRLEHWDEVRKTVELITQQLETITEVIQLIHAQSISPSDCREVSEDLDRFMEDLKNTDNTVQDLWELGIKE